VPGRILALARVVPLAPVPIRRSLLELIRLLARGPPPSWTYRLAPALEPESAHRTRRAAEQWE